MALSKTTEAYIGFLKISDKAYAEQVRYYEDTFRVLLELPEEEKLELELAYLNALFELGAYHKFLTKVDRVIPQLYDQQADLLEDKDALQKLLFRKACSFYHQFRNQEAKELAEQTIRMYPEVPEHAMLLQKIHRRYLDKKTTNLKALSIGLYLLSGLCIAICLFIIDTFYLQYQMIGQWVWQGIFLLASCSLIGTEAYIYFESKRRVKEAIDKKSAST